MQLDPYASSETNACVVSHSVAVLFNRRKEWASLAGTLPVGPVDKART